MSHIPAAACRACAEGAVLWFYGGLALCLAGAALAFCAAARDEAAPSAWRTCCSLLGWAMMGVGVGAAMWMGGS